MRTILPLIVLIFISCNDKTPRKKIYAEQLTGQWRNVYIRIDISSYRNTDSSKVFEVNEQNWEQVMGIRPVRTYYWSDGTYNSEHLNLKDSVFYNPAGRWKLDGDSLFMNDTFPDRRNKYSYRVAVNGNMAEFWGLEDSDNDGKKDDRYYGTQRKFTGGQQ
jgi:hypothetical protein